MASPIQMLTPPSRATVRSQVKFSTRGGALRSALLTSTYDHDPIQQEDVLVAQQLSYWVDGQLVTFFNQVGTDDWVDENGAGIDVTEITPDAPITPEPGSGGGGNTITYNYFNRVRFAKTPDNRLVVGHFIDGKLVWTYANNDPFTGDPNSLVIENEPALENHVTDWYELLNEQTNTWLKLNRVVSTDGDGNILDVRYFQDNGAPRTPQKRVRQRPVSIHTTEVFQINGGVDASLDFDTYSRLKTGSEVVGITINITRRMSRQTSQAVLVLGETSETIPHGHKLYHDESTADCKIGTFPVVRLTGPSSSAVINMRFEKPANVLTEMPAIP